MSTKGFLGGLGQGMMQLSATYGQTGLANLEAEAQRMKEERLATMQMAQFSLQSQKDVYQMEMGEKKFALLQDEDLRRQEELDLKKQKQQYDQDLPDYEKVEKDVYKPIYDPVTEVLTDYEKADEDIYFVDKKTGTVYQLKDGKLIEADPNTKIGKDEDDPDPDAGRVDPDADRTKPVELTQEEYINWWIARQQRKNPSYEMTHEMKVKFIKDYFSKYNKPFKEGGTIYFTPEATAEVEVDVIGPESFVDFVPPDAGMITQNNKDIEQANKELEGTGVDVTDLYIPDPALVTGEGQGPSKEDTTIPKVKEKETNILKMDYDQAKEEVIKTIKVMIGQKMTKNQVVDALFKASEALKGVEEGKDSKYAKALRDVIIGLDKKGRDNIWRKITGSN